MRRFLAFLIVSTITLPACHPAAAPAEPGKVPGPAKVVLVQPQRKVLRRAIEQPGTIQAYEETPLFARVSGYVSKLHADIGQKVHGPKLDSSGQEVEPGEILAELSVPETEQEAKQKQALVRQAEAEVEQSSKALATVEAGVSRAQALADRWVSEAERFEKLVKAGTIDAQILDETHNQLRSAEAALNESKAMVAKAQADVRVAQAKVEVARADASRVEALLALAKIRAPFDGVVTRRRVSTGDFIQPAPGKGEGIFTVARLDPVRVVISVPEADAYLVRDRTEVKLTIDALRGPPVVAAASRNSWSLDPTTRTLRVEVDLPNKEGLLRPGMYLYARISGELPESWTLPAAAVVRQGDTWVCFAIESDKALRVPVQVGASDGQFTEVTKMQKNGAWQNVTGQEKVAGKAQGLTDGQVVTIGD